MFSALAFVALFCVCAVLAFTRHPIYAFYSYLASIFVHPPSRWWEYLLPDLRWALLAAAIAVVAVLVHRGKLNAKPVWLTNGPAILLTMYALWMWVQTPWALDRATHVEGSAQYLKYMVAFWLVYRMVESKRSLTDLMLGISLGCGLLGLFAQFTGRDGGRLDGVGGPGMDDSNTLGMYLATGVVVCIGLLLTQKGWRRWLSAATLLITFNGFVLANSRGALIGLATGVLVVALCKAREHGRLFWSLILVAAVGSTFVVDKTFVDRMLTIGDVREQNNLEADKSARSRVVIYEAQLRMAADYPMGVGFRGTVVLSPRYLDSEWLTRVPDIGTGSEGRSSHNTFMTTLVEQGVPGALMYSGQIVWLLLAMFRIRRLGSRGADPELKTMTSALCGALVVVFVSGLATDYLMAEVQFWLFAALVSAFQLAEVSLAEPVPVGRALPLRLRPAKS